MSGTFLLGEVDTEALVQRWVTKAAGEEENQREGPRTPFFSPATLYSEAAEVPAICRDISKDGVGIILRGDAPVAGNTTLAIELHKQQVYLNLNLEWTRDLGSGWWSAGGRLNASSINGISLTFLKLSGFVERRVHRRYSFCHPFFVYPNVDESLSRQNDGVYLTEMTDESETCALSLDISSGGIRLICSEQMDVTQQIWIRKPKTDFLLRGKVRLHRKLGNGYCVLGIQFETT